MSSLLPGALAFAGTILYAKYGALSSTFLPSRVVPVKTVDGKKHVIFVLGGPGAGKGTVCSRLCPSGDGDGDGDCRKGRGGLTVRSTHAFFSAGDLLRAERKRDSPCARVINDAISSGSFVPASITVGLIKSAFEGSGAGVFLLDGFPRNEDNVGAWEEGVGGGVVVDLVLFLECPEETMLGRIMDRGRTSGRNDDTLEVARKRFENFRRETMPIVNKYEKEGKVVRVRSDRPVDRVYDEVEEIVVKNMERVILA